MDPHQRTIFLSMFILFFQFYKLLKQRHQRQLELLLSSSRPTSSDDELLLLFSTIKSRNGRTIWAHLRSDEWARLVLLGKTLKGSFEKNFRMSHNLIPLSNFTLFSVRVSFSIANVLEPYITLQDTTYRDSVPSRVRLMAFLYHVCQGNNYLTVGNAFAIIWSVDSWQMHSASHLRNPLSYV
jgi:hypothetical protein